MRFDILDEYSTLVPFRLGAFKQNRIVQHPATATEAVGPGIIANCVSRLRALFESVWSDQRTRSRVGDTRRN